VIVEIGAGSAGVRSWGVSGRMGRGGGLPRAAGGIGGGGHGGGFAGGGGMGWDVYRRGLGDAGAGV